MTGQTHAYSEFSTLQLVNNFEGAGCGGKMFSHFVDRRTSVHRERRRPARRRKKESSTEGGLPRARPLRCVDPGSDREIVGQER